MKNLIHFISFLLLGLNINAQNNWIQEGSDLNGDFENDLYGRALSLSGNGKVLAVGASYYSVKQELAGIVKVYKNQNNQWVQIGQDIHGEDSRDLLGETLSLNFEGDVLALGVNPRSSKDGYVKIFKLINNEWALFGSPLRKPGGFGHSVSLNAKGDILAIGNRSSTDAAIMSGEVLIYQNNGITLDNWVQIGQSIKGSLSWETLGHRVRLNDSGTIVAAHGSTSEDGPFLGHIKIFELNNNSWTQLGDRIVGVKENDNLGNSFDMDSTGKIIAVGVNNGWNTGESTGRVQVYNFSENTWNQIGQNIDNLGGYAFPVSSKVSLSGNGNLLAVGYTGDERDNKQGSTRVFQNENNSWIQIGETIFGETTREFFGGVVDLSDDGSKIAIGAYLNADNGEKSGQVRVYQFSDNDLSIPNRQSSSDHQIYVHNPINNELTISGTINFIKEIILTDLRGKIILNLKHTPTYTYNTSHLPKGMYILRIITNTNEVLHKKIIKD